MKVLAALIAVAAHALGPAPRAHRVPAPGGRGATRLGPRFGRFGDGFGFGGGALASAATGVQKQFFACLFTGALFFSAPQPSGAEMMKLLEESLKPDVGAVAAARPVAALTDQGQMALDAANKADNYAKNKPVTFGEFDANNAKVDLRFDKVDLMMVSGMITTVSGFVFAEYRAQDIKADIRDIKAEIRASKPRFLNISWPWER
jgi:hypothetical protein